jgi:glycine/D-amino acid oxidase-like deaminating enzyme
LYRHEEQPSLKIRASILQQECPTRAMALSDQLPIVVIGAGIVGAATAFFLSRASIAVRLLDASAPAAAASGAADGAVSVASKKPGPLMHAALGGISVYRELEASGVLAGAFKSRSTLILAQDDAEAAVLEHHAAALTGAGVCVDWMADAVLRQRVPVLSRGIRAAAEVRGEGHAIGYQVVERLIRTAGLRVDRNCRVEALLYSPDGTRVVGAETGQGRIDAAGVVLAAGGGSAALIGLEKVLMPRKGQLLVTERAGALNGALPGSLMSCRYLMSKATTQTVGAPSPRGFGLVIDPLRTGQFLIGGTREDEIEATDNDIDAVRRLLSDAVTVLPGLAGLRLLRAFAGVRTATADGMPLVGRMPGVDNLFVATGFEGDGICLGPLTGKIISGLVIGQSPEIDISSFDPERFAGRLAA